MTRVYAERPVTCRPSGQHQDPLARRSASLKLMVQLYRQDTDPHQLSDSTELPPSLKMERKEQNLAIRHQRECERERRRALCQAQLVQEESGIRDDSI